MIEKKKETKERVNLNIDHSEPAFFCEGFTISHKPNKFILDFTQSFPKFDVIEGRMNQTVCIKHKTVVMDPMLAKDFLKRMTHNMSKYEEHFEKIKMKRGRKKESKQTVTAPVVKKAETRYIG